MNPVKNYLILPVAMLFVLRVNGQINLVPNPSFEDTVECPHFASEIYKAAGWHTSKYTPDYFHQCDWLNGYSSVPGNFRGYQFAEDGDAYAGIATYSRNAPNFTETFTCQLLSTLIIGKIRCVIQHGKL